MDAEITECENIVTKVCGKFEATIIESEDLKLWNEKIRNVKDMFPEYGQGFIDALLDFCDGNLEDAVARLSDLDFPPEVAGIDKKLAVCSVTSDRDERSEDVNFPLTSTRHSVADSFEFLSNPGSGQVKK